MFRKIDDAVEIGYRTAAGITRSYDHIADAVTNRDLAGLPRPGVADIADGEVAEKVRPGLKYTPKPLANEGDRGMGGHK